jgi:hypothetical protein
MHHVAPLSPVPSVDCPYFLSPRGCGLCDFRSPLAIRHSPLSYRPLFSYSYELLSPQPFFFSHQCKSPGMWEYPALSTPAHPRVVAATLEAGAGEKLTLRQRGSSGPKRVVLNALSCNDCRGNGTTQAVIREEF